MAMNIKSPEAEALARQVAAATEETLTGAIIAALREELDRIERGKQAAALADQLNEIARRATSLPLLDERPPEDIIGYDKTGMPR